MLLSVVVGFFISNGVDIFSSIDLHHLALSKHFGAKELLASEKSGFIYQFLQKVVAIWVHAQLLFTQNP